MPGPSFLTYLCRPGSRDPLLRFVFFMSHFKARSDIAGRIQADLERFAEDSEHGLDVIRMIAALGGFMVETVLLFDCPEEAIEGAYDHLAALLESEPLEGTLSPESLPPASVLDYQTECGRGVARAWFEEWLDCGYEFHEMASQIVASNMRAWESEGIPRAESFRLLIECMNRCMGYELAAQELCDIVIEDKIGIEGWSLGDSISGLSAMAGRRLALSLGGKATGVVQGSDLPDQLDRIAWVMTQEAYRQGIPAGSDWRFGLAANDTPVNAPLALVRGMEPPCREFFRLLGMRDLRDQAVSCAKAAGRMLALAAGGDIPYIEPVIAKPLAMAAMTETYRSVFLGRAES